jgi:hypothetical protein
VVVNGSQITFARRSADRTGGDVGARTHDCGARSEPQWSVESAARERERECVCVCVCQCHNACHCDTRSVRALACLGLRSRLQRAEPLLPLLVRRGYQHEAPLRVGGRVP